MQKPLLNGRYLLLGQLGKGGMGVVYKAADTLLGNRLIAIKEMSQRHLNIGEIASVTARFKQEAVLLASLSHQNLPRIYDHFSERGNSYLVMEFIDGDTLADFLQQAGGKGLLVKEVLLIAEHLCSVLHYLHTHQPPIIFRDLKPGNVMITSAADHLYLIDFGIARIFKPAQLQDTLPFGTRGYAPPEQYGGGTTERSDIYSFGATLHQSLTGLDPSQATVPFHFPPIPPHNPQVPPRLEKLIAHMVEIDPERRPPSILVIKRELQRMKQELEGGNFAPALTASGKVIVPALPGTAVGTTLRTCRKHSDSIQTIAWSPDGRYLASGGRDKLVHVWDALTGDNVVVYRDHLLWVYSAAWSQDGRFIATGGAEGEVHFWADPSGKNIYKYLASSRVIKAVAWSHARGSTKIVIGCEDATVHSWNTATGNTPLIYKGHTKEITCVAWSPDDKQAVSGSRDKTVQIWDACVGNAHGTYRGHTKEVYAVAWSPGGKFIASAGEDKTVRVWDAVTGKTSYICRCHTSAVCTIAWSPDGTRIASAGDDKIVYVWQAS